MTALGDFSAGDVLTAADLNAIGTWTTFTPVWTNLTVGDGTVNAYYCQVNDIVFVEVRVLFGSTTSISGSVSMNHPVGTAGVDAQYNGVAQFVDTGTIIRLGHPVIFSSNANLRVLNTSSTYAAIALLSATVPFTWAATDILTVTYWYRRP